jgi:hypothetical protein
MSFRMLLVAGAAVTLFAGVARADEDTYRCGDSVCYDDQADETRRLNEMQLENPGAVPSDEDGSYDPADDDDSYGDDPNGQGGPYYPVEPGDDESMGPPSADEPDDGAYPGDDNYPDATDDGGYDDDEDMPYPDEGDDDD